MLIEVTITTQGVDMGVVSEKWEGFYVVDYKQQYDEHIGLRTDNNWANEIQII